MKVLLIVYDNDSYIHFFPLGIAYIASALRNAGHDVEIYNQDIHHYPEEHLITYLDKNNFDIVCLGIIAGYYQYQKLLKISKAIDASKNRPAYYILGGHGPSPEPEYFLKKTNADFIVIGEGEETIVELLAMISKKQDYSKVKGIAYRNDDKVIVNERRPPIQEVDSIPMPAYDMFQITYYRLLRLPNSTNSDYVMPILSARGCTFKCNFCYRMDTGYRPRKSEAIMEEIKYLQKDYGINYIDFADELLMSSEKRVEEICEAIIKSKLKFKWFCNGRLNYAKPKILKKMKNAGCVFINYGIESFDDTTLKNMNKALTTKQIARGIKTTIKVGICPGFNIIFGNIGEDKEILNKGVEFLLKYDDGAQLRTIRPVTPYPGSPLYYYAIEKGLLKNVEDFYENKHINSDLLSVNFTDMSDEEFHKSLMEANTTLLNNYYKKKLNQMIGITKNLYLRKDVAFRGYRHV
jgi:radical SAM superfamily enzyme YgiQ (UPF0313 family)